MAKMTYDFFNEEDPFNESELKQRLDSVQDGVNALEPDSACEKGCLNDQHIPSFLSFSATTEFPMANGTVPSGAALGYEMTTTEGAGPGTFTAGPAGFGHVSCYYNQLNTSIPLSAPTGEQKPPPEDGVWEPIISGAIPLVVPFPDTDFTEFVNPAVVVLLNVHVEMIFFEWEGGDSWPTNRDSWWLYGNGVAFTIQMQNADTPGEWHHIYDPNGETPLGRPLRRTERRVGATSWNDAVLPNLATVAGRRPFVPINRDVSIRCSIGAEDLLRAYDPANPGQLLPLRRINAVRGALSLCGLTGNDGSGTPLVEVTVGCVISNANITVLMPRAKQRTT